MPPKRIRKRCSVDGCEKGVQVGGVCISHGADIKRCSVDGCEKQARSGGLCISHGAEVKRCSVDGCEKGVRVGGVCYKHGAKHDIKRCSVDGCEKGVINGGLCISHGAKAKRCSVDGCEKQAQHGGLCISHGAKTKRCSVDGCEKRSINSGLCISHGAKTKSCSVDGCKKQAQKDGVCTKHHTEYVPLGNISRGAKAVMGFLEEIKIHYTTEKRYEYCRSIYPLPFDFYLPELNALIEYDGIQHVEPIEHWGGQIGFEYRQMCDGIKNNYVCDNNIRLLRIPHKVPLSRIPFVVNRFIIECRL
jgi:hypothetical protein